ncbi:MAG: hypothetical protein CALGDGBN_02033 [Pseudomonadales bacterium]|nr:hypothetical protein [Pseudomonadales bacterium]
MPIVSTESWTLELPDEWSAEHDDDVVVIGDEDGVSCLEISSLVLDEGEVGDEDLGEFARDLLDAGVRPRTARIGDWTGQLFEHDDADGHWREWFLRHGAHFVYAGYHCLPEHAGMDDAAIAEILATLEPR